MHRHHRHTVITEGYRMGQTRTGQTLHIYRPYVECGDCHFGAGIHGKWSVEGGRLVFRADEDFQPGRGPDLGGCCESSPVVEFSQVEVIEGSWDPRLLTQEEIAALRESARRARLL